MQRHRGAHVMAINHNRPLGLLLRSGRAETPDAHRHHDASPEEAANVLLLAPA
ncbi:MAG: hypothetical protein ACK2UA_09305 [Anaerolineae bacterium]